MSSVCLLAYYQEPAEPPLKRPRRIIGSQVSLPSFFLIFILADVTLMP